MQLTFESLAELQDFVHWVQAARQVAPVMSATAKVVSGAPNIVVKDLPLRADSDVMAEVLIAEAEKTVTVRKRRSKAEMEAARAAETANPEPAETAENPFALPPTQEEQRQAATEELSPEVDAKDGPSDAVEFIKSRLAERPEVSQVEHLNLARTFIGKHGMEKYNASFPLAGLTPNVMGYSPADCATHAAALDFLSLE